MLIEFSVENFASFKNKNTFSMEAEDKKELIENTFSFDNSLLLKTAAIYGGNASGKSNFVQALMCAIIMVRTSNYMNDNKSWNYILRPFLFNDVNPKKPTKFWFTFVVDGIKYKYYFSSDIYCVYEEILEAYYTQKPTTLFKRTDCDKFEFTNDKKILEDIASKNTKNKLFLATATTWNYEKAKAPFKWFSSSIDVFSKFNQINESDLLDYSSVNSDLKDFALKIFNEADIKINDISVNYKNIEIPNINNPLMPGVNRENKMFKIDFLHEVETKDGKKESYLLNMNYESDGTKSLFTLIPHLKRAFERKYIIVADELESSLHPLLVEFVIKLFNNKEINTHGSQLIFTTHASNLLNLELFRRDQIWFTDKDSKTGESILYPLDSFSIRKDENILKGYLNGRYGAIPFIKNKF